MFYILIALSETNYTREGGKISKTNTFFIIQDAGCVQLFDCYVTV